MGEPRVWASACDSAAVYRSGIWKAKTWRPGGLVALESLAGTAQKVLRASSLTTCGWTNVDRIPVQGTFTLASACQ